MKHLRLYTMAGILLMPALALAHAHLESSVPVANSSIAAMPPRVMLHFSEAVKITVLNIEKQGGKEKVELKPPAAAVAIVQVDAPKLGAGVYLLNWRGLSDDGHVMTGTLHFTVTGK